MNNARVNLAVFLGLAALAACGVDLELAGETVACTRPSDCPAPLACSLNAGRCVDPSFAETDAPQLVSAASTDLGVVRLTFSEPVDHAAADIGSYALRPAVAITRALQSDDLREVTLDVDGLVPGFEYTVTASGIADVWGNVLGTPDSATFIGFGAFPDRGAPAIIAPPVGSSATGTVRLVWARVALAYEYIVEVSYDEAFTAPLAASFTVLDPQSSVDFPITTSGPHYWRVRANTTLPGVYGTGRFIGLGDTVHVFCPADVSACSDDGKFGTAASPLQTVSGAVALARAIGAREVHLAARGGDAAYFDSVTVSGDLRILGGYAPDFAETTRDPRVNITTVSTQTGQQRAVFTMLDSSGVTSIEGLRILGWRGHAVIIQGINSGTVIVRDNEIWARGSPGRGIYLNDSRTDSVEHVVIADNHLYQIVPDELDNIGLQFVMGQGVLIERAGATVSNNVMEMPERCNRTAYECSGLRVDNGAVRFIGNRVIIPMTQVTSNSVDAVEIVSSAFELRDNVVRVEGTRDQTNRALVVTDYLPVATAVIANNVFMSGGSSNSYGASSIATSSATTLVNNVFATAVSDEDPYALRFDVPASTVIARNVLLAPPGAQYCHYSERGVQATVAGNVGVGCDEVIYSGIHPGGEDTTSVRFTSIADLHFASYPDDLHWTSQTPASARDAGPYSSTPP